MVRSLEEQRDRWGHAADGLNGSCPKRVYTPREANGSGCERTEHANDL